LHVFYNDLPTTELYTLPYTTLFRSRLLKAKQRQRKAERVQHDEHLLAQTGIRALRTQPVFTTPNIYPPAAFEQIELNGDSELREDRKSTRLNSSHVAISYAVFCLKK